MTDKTAYEIAAELLEIRQEIGVLKQAEKAASEELRKRIDAGEDQDIYQYVPQTSLKISSRLKTLKWAQKYAPMLLTVDTKGARQMFIQDALTGKMGTPEKNGFVLAVTHQLKESKTKGGQEIGYDIAA